uniref:cystathionine gamma-lyase n=1 Tax=Scolopendra viridis TaxID=118503 RepID=A0A4D5R9J9_SCOVI
MEPKCERPLDNQFATKAIHVGQKPEQWKSMAIVPPISLATTFKQFSPGEHAGFDYARSGNPTRNCLEDCLAALDNGSYALCFASGTAASMTICHLLKAGDHIICMHDVYGGTNRLFRMVMNEMGIETSFVDCTNIKNIENAIQNKTKMIWIETPSNPTLQIVDIKGVAELKKKKDILLVVDNTFMTSYFQRPLELGADIVDYSLTKYMNGHTDCVMGAIVTNNKDIYEKLKFLQNAIGAVPSPFDCFLVNRGLKTLHLRMREHMKNGLAVAAFLEKHPLVEKVIHPGLPSHPQHELALKQCSGFSGMTSFYLKGGLTETQKFLQNLKLITLAESLGGYESLAEHPALMTHATVPEEQRRQLKITDNLIRLSIGLESVEDIKADLDQALKNAVKTK